MRWIFPRFRKANPCFYLIAGCLAISHPAVAQDAAPAKTPVPAPYDRPRMPLTDILILELINGEPVNSEQVAEVINKEFGSVWNNKDNPFPNDPKDGQEVKAAKYQSWIYLAAVKASFLDMSRHGGWPSGYGKMREEGFPAKMLVHLKALSALPLDKVNRTMIHFSIITPAWIAGDREAMTRAIRQLKADWPDNPYIARKISRIQGMAESFFPKK